MSDLMLFGVLKMPYEMAMESELSRRQLYQRVQQLVRQVEQAAQRQPLTNEQILSIFATCHQGRAYPQDLYSGPRAMRLTEGRAIEAAHGIGGKA